LDLLFAFVPQGRIIEFFGQPYKIINFYEKNTIIKKVIYKFALFIVANKKKRRSLT
jgi:hypothetical protein